MNVFSIKKADGWLIEKPESIYLYSARAICMCLRVGYVDLLLAGRGVSTYTTAVHPHKSN